MQHWLYVGLDAKGSKVNGKLKASDKTAAMAMMIERGLSPLEVKPVTQRFSLFNRLSSADTEQLTTELALLLRNAVPLDRALEMLSEHHPNPLAATMLADITEDVRSGVTLNQSFARFPQYFDSLFCEMVKVGEESGQLATALDKLSQNLKFQNDLKSKVNQAMIYPMFILAVCLVSVWAIFNFIVPSMSGLFANMAEIPAYTRFLLDSSAFVRSYQQWLAVGLLGMILAFLHYRQQPWFKAALHSLFRRLPLINRGMLLAERIRYVSAMYLMLSSGIPLVQALGFGVSVVQDLKLKNQLQRVRDEVSHGKMLSDVIAGTDIMEPIMLSLVKVGEESGRLELVFGEIFERSRRSF